MLAKQAGVLLRPISKTLAHSDKEITKAYVITADSLIKQLVKITFINLKKWLREISGKLLIVRQKRYTAKILECLQRLMSPLALSLNWE